MEAKDAFALCFFVPDLIDDALLSRLPRLRILAGFGKGYDNVDVAAATARRIWVTNVPDALTDGTADLAWALLLGLARGVRAGDALVRAGRFSGWSASARLGTSVSGKILGIVGYGAIGRAIAHRAAGFGMRVLHCDLNTATRLEEVLGLADFIVLALPLTDATRRTIDARRLRLIKKSAYLVNIARGSVVDEAAVADALARDALAGYASDVFEMEDRQYPERPAGIDARLLASERTLLTPHIGTATHEDRLALVQAQSVLDALDGRRPATAVNDVPA
jgi:phosphonate dehydrogenase